MRPIVVMIVLNAEDAIVMNAIIVTMDVTGLYTNIPQEECRQTAHEALNERINQEVPSQFIVNLFTLILKYNIF